MANNTGIKYGGREAGTPNKLTKELKAVLKNVVHQELEKLPETFEKLEPKDRVELIIKLLPYIVPKVLDVGYNFGEGDQLDWS